MKEPMPLPPRVLISFQAITFYIRPSPNISTGRWDLKFDRRPTFQDGQSAAQYLSHLPTFDSLLSLKFILHIWLPCCCVHPYRIRYSPVMWCLLGPSFYQCSAGSPFDTVVLLPNFGSLKKSTIKMPLNFKGLLVSGFFIEKLGNVERAFHSTTNVKDLHLVASFY